MTPLCIHEAVPFHTQLIILICLTRSHFTSGQLAQSVWMNMLLLFTRHQGCHFTCYCFCSVVTVSVCFCICFHLFTVSAVTVSVYCFCVTVSVHCICLLFLCYCTCSHEFKCFTLLSWLPSQLITLAQYHGSHMFAGHMSLYLWLTYMILFTREYLLFLVHMSLPQFTSYFPCSHVVHI